jgi:hypothetical protein
MSELKKDRIIQDFSLRRSRQVSAIAVALFMVFTLAVLHRFDLLGGFSKESVFAFQILVIASFIGFTASNWRCPSCKSFLGRDIEKHLCGKCRARLR